MQYKELGPGMFQMKVSIRIVNIKMTFADISLMQISLTCTQNPKSKFSKYLLSFELPVSCISK